jgi:hypothetical protein
MRAPRVAPQNNLWVRGPADANLMLTLTTEKNELDACFEFLLFKSCSRSPPAKVRDRRATCSPSSISLNATKILLKPALPRSQLFSPRHAVAAAPRAPTMPRNKNRVYLVLYERSATGGHHHMALMLAPKAASAAPLAYHSWRYRVAPSGDSAVLTGRLAFVAEPVANRPRKAGALVLLGKCTQGGEYLRELLAKVPTAAGLDSCASWTTEAIQVSSAGP